MRVALRIRKELYDAIEKHRGGRKWGTVCQEVIEAGLESLGWKFKSQLPPEE